MGTSGSWPHRLVRHHSEAVAEPEEVRPLEGDHEVEGRRATGVVGRRGVRRRQGDRLPAEREEDVRGGVGRRVPSDRRDGRLARGDGDAGHRRDAGRNPLES